MSVKAKNDMNCGEVRRSSRAGKKIMKKVCKDGKEKLVHAGAKGYKHNYSKEGKKSFRSRHKCNEKKAWDSAQKVACQELWGKDMKVGKKRRAEDGGVMRGCQCTNCDNCKKRSALKVLIKG